MSQDPNAMADTEDFEFAALSEAVNYRNGIVREFAPFLTGRVLEIGAGVGQTSEAILRLPGIEEFIGIEPDPRFQSAFRKRLPNVRLIAGKCGDLHPDEHFDAAVMVNVLEHIEDDRAELSALYVRLRQTRGHLCFLVPARPELYSKLDAHFGHFRRYTRTELRTKLTLAGFTIVKLHYFNLIGYLAWGIRHRLFGSMSFDTRQVRAFDRAVFPFAHAIESKFLRPPIGQSVLGVVRA